MAGLREPETNLCIVFQRHSSQRQRRYSKAAKYPSSDWHVIGHNPGGRERGLIRSLRTPARAQLVTSGTMHITRASFDIRGTASSYPLTQR